MSEKRRHSEICIVINNKSQGSIAKHLRCDELLYYTLITQSAGERIFKIDEHLAKLQAKWLVVSCAPFGLHFCPQRCWSRQINRITWVLQTETVTSRYYVNRQINVSYYQRTSNYYRPVLTYWPIGWRNQWLIMYGILLRQLFFVWLISEDIYFKTGVWVAKSCITVCFTYSLRYVIFWTQIFHKVV